MYKWVYIYVSVYVCKSWPLFIKVGFQNWMAQLKQPTVKIPSRISPIWTIEG